MTNRLYHLLPVLFLTVVFSPLSGVSFGGDSWHSGDMTGGKVTRAVVSFPKSNPSDRGWFEVEVGEVILADKSAVDSKMVTLTTFVSARAKEGTIVAWGQFGGGGLVDSGLQSLNVKGGGQLSKVLPAGKYDLIVTVVGQVEGEQLRMLDIHMVPFEVTGRTTGPIER